MDFVFCLRCLFYSDVLFFNLSVVRSQTLHSIYFKSELVETIKVFKPVLKSGHTLCAPALWCIFTSVKGTAISTCLVWRP